MKNIQINRHAVKLTVPELVDTARKDLQWAARPTPAHVLHVVGDLCRRFRPDLTEAARDGLVRQLMRELKVTDEGRPVVSETQPVAEYDPRQIMRYIAPMTTPEKLASDVCISEHAAGKTLRALVRRGQLVRDGNFYLVPR